MAVGAGHRTVGVHLGAVLGRQSPIGRMTTGSVMTLVAGNLAGAAQIVFAVATRATGCAVHAHRRAVLVGRHPAVGMGAGGTVVALVAGNEAPTAEVVVAMAVGAGLGVRVRRRTVGVVFHPGDRMTARPVMAVPAAGRTVVALQILTVVTPRILVAVTWTARDHARFLDVLAVEFLVVRVIPGRGMRLEVRVVDTLDTGGQRGQSQEEQRQAGPAEIRCACHDCHPPWQRAQVGEFSPSLWHATQFSISNRPSSPWRPPSPPLTQFPCEWFRGRTCSAMWHELQ